MEAVAAPVDRTALESILEMARQELYDCLPRLADGQRRFDVTLLDRERHHCVLVLPRVTADTAGEADARMPALLQELTDGLDRLAGELARAGDGRQSAGGPAALEWPVLVDCFRRMSRLARNCRQELYCRAAR